MSENWNNIITLERLNEFAPQSRHDILDGIWQGRRFFSAYHVQSPRRIQHCLAQLAHESDGFHTTREYASGRAYEGREDLGNIKPGDGSRFRGRGLIQITGRSNYRAVALALKQPYVTQPELMEQFPHALLVSLWFWEKHGLNELADKDDLIHITKRINGGLNGYRQRVVWLKRAKTIFV